MSSPDDGLPTPRTASRAISTSSSASTLAGSHIVDVADASRVLECSQVERQLGLQRLIRHYLSQILYGCKSAYCTTPTCLSYQKRNAPRPVRPPTQLTARALAHYLAGQNDPRRGLCPHQLKFQPESHEISGAVGVRLQRAGDGTRQYSIFPSAKSVVGELGDSPYEKDVPGQAEPSGRQEPLQVRQQVVEAVKKRHQTRKDKKSLTQNMFDTVTMIYAYSKQLPSSTSLYQSLRLSSPLLQDTSTSLNVSNAPSQTGAKNALPHATSATLTNSFSVTRPVKSAAIPDRQHPQSNNQISNSLTSPTFSDGQQVHHVPHHVYGSSRVGRPSKVTAQTSLNGTIERRKAFAKSRSNPQFSEDEVPGIKRIPSPIPVSRCVEGRMQTTTSTGIMVPVLSTLSCGSLDALKDEVYDHRKNQVSYDSNFSVDYDMNRHFQPSTPFANRSLFYTLGDPQTLLKSFRDPSKVFETSPLPHLDSARLAHSFRDWNCHNGALIFDSLCISLEALFTPPPELNVQKSPRLVPSRKGMAANSPTDRLDDGSSKPFNQRYLDNLEAAHIVMICIHALTSSVSVSWPHTWAQVRKLRAGGTMLPNSAPKIDGYMHSYLNIIDDLEYEPAIRLAEHLVRAIGARTCFERILFVTRRQAEERAEDAGVGSLVDIVVHHLVTVEKVALATKRRTSPNGNQSSDPGWTVSSVLLEWLKTVVMKRWDSKPEINKWSSAGSAIFLIHKLCNSGAELNLHPEMFEFRFLDERMDAVEDPVKYLDWEEQPNTMHILQYPALFPEKYLVRYFRTINFASMMGQYNHTTRTHRMRLLLQRFLRAPHLWLTEVKMKVTLSEYLILNVSRDQPLKDTFDQLWRREKRMLLKPLKVQMGVHEGELGADHGGVTYEFFRVVLSEAFRPEYGMFTLDPQTRMIWFQPGTLEPDWKFEMIGIIFSLAIYNGITLPVTLPLVLYTFLLQPHRLFQSMDLKDCLRLIQDGWPDLAHRFTEMLAFEGDVANVYMREYAFSYEAFGQNMDHKMDDPYPSAAERSRGPIPQRPDFELVTNENKTAFVTQYIEHLTYHSVRPQLEAFHRGFTTCLHPKSLSLFTPASLRHLTEGHHFVSISSLRQSTRYQDGYSPTHPTITTFWRIVQSFSQLDCRRLLEFVTASDRIPVTGYEAVVFIIKRLPASDLLPTSSTCFGKLYLPDYEDERKMEEKLCLAIRNSKGFGVI